MTIQELFRSVTFDLIWNQIAQEYEIPEKGFSFYQSAFQEISDMLTVPLKSDELLMVAKVREYSNPHRYVYETIIKKAGDPERYCLDLTPWEGWLCYSILEKSLSVYGSVDVAAEILYAMTVFGFSAEAVKCRCEKEIKILLEIEEEQARGEMKYYSLEEVSRELGLEEKIQTEEEIALEKKQMEEAYEENMRIYASLLEE